MYYSVNNKMLFQYLNFELQSAIQKEVLVFLVRRGAEAMFVPVKP